MTFFSLIQHVAIAEKVKHAPDGSYQIGVAIGSFLPFIVLVGIAYWMYYRAKNKQQNE